MMVIKNKYTIGIDIGGTNIDYGVVDDKGNIIVHGRVKTSCSNSPEKLIEILYNDFINSIDGRINLKDIVGIGIGAPDANYLKGTIENPVNLFWPKITCIVNLVEKYFKIPAKLLNDANVAALGEMYYGKAKEMKNFMIIMLGTGVGSGIVIDGKVINGNDGFAGEIGSMVINKDSNARCINNSAKGSLEAYCSASGIRYTAQKMLNDSKDDSILRSLIIESITAKDIYEAAVRGDEMALNIFNYTGNLLGEALSNIILILNPEAVILAGGVAEAGNYILKPTFKSFQDNTIDSLKGKTKLMISSLINSDGAILGASILGWDVIN